MNAASKYLDIEDMRDMDYVITTRELAKWAKEENIDFASLKDSDYDSFMGEASGAGVIFGNTGGVMELLCALPISSLQAIPPLLIFII